MAAPIDQFVHLLPEQKLFHGLTVPELEPVFHLCGMMEVAKDVGGDFYDVITVDQHHIAIASGEAPLYDDLTLLRLGYRPDHYPSQSSPKV